ncbi:ROK family protein [Haloferula sp.]|uniref:ROK family protein n=1 Tax=Haloferula sp. TaxID=2497595 RepID=UPI003C7366C6
MNILTIDIGGTNIKILATGQSERRKFPSGPEMTPTTMVEGVKEIVGDWEYDVVSIGYPGPVRKGKIAKEPHNLGQGWMGFDFEAAFHKPVRIINDAAMQALGSYQGGTMLFLGFGTGLGSALVAEGVVIPMELAHLSYKKGTYESYLGERGRKKLGKAKWRKHVARCVARLGAALQLDDVVLGGGNAKRLKELPKGSRLGSNANAFIGGYRMWESAEPNPVFPIPQD